MDVLNPSSFTIRMLASILLTASEWPKKPCLIPAFPPSCSSYSFLCLCRGWVLQYTYKRPRLRTMKQSLQRFRRTTLLLKAATGWQMGSGQLVRKFRWSTLANLVTFKSCSRLTGCKGLSSHEEKNERDAEPQFKIRAAFMAVATAFRRSREAIACNLRKREEKEEKRRQVQQLLVHYNCNPMHTWQWVRLSNELGSYFRAHRHRIRLQICPSILQIIPDTKAHNIALYKMGGKYCLFFSPRVA